MPRLPTPQGDDAHLTDSLSREQIRNFPGLTNEVLVSRLCAARACGMGVRLGRQPPRCSIASPGGQDWMREGVNLNAAAAAALADLEPMLKGEPESVMRFKRLRRLEHAGAEVTEHAGCKVIITMLDGRAITGDGTVPASALDEALRKAEEALSRGPA